jgi:leucyl/phenylalanyl-tRNA---protein transferase
LPLDETPPALESLGMSRSRQITPELLLEAYRCGIFPMAESATSKSLHWYEPEWRGLLPLETFHVPRSLAKDVRRSAFSVTANKAFSEVMTACAAPARGRETTWINDDIHALYGALHSDGHAHSIEVWSEGTLVGGLYGVSLGAAFFGESMFHRATNASKIALVHLVARLKRAEYRLLDTQFVTQHLTQFGAIEVHKDAYRNLLSQATSRKAREAFGEPLSGEDAVQLATG